jgi:hypothetical protein
MFSPRIITALAPSPSFWRRAFFRVVDAVRWHLFIDALHRHRADEHAASFDRRWG